MKKTLFTLALALMGMTMQAQTKVEELIKEFKSNPEVTYIKIDSSMVSKMVGGDKDDLDETAKAFKLLGSNGYLEVITTEGNKGAVSKLIKKVRKLDMKGYEPMVSSNEDDEESKIYTRSEGDKIKEMLIVNIEKDTLNLVRIVGDEIDFSEIQKVIN